MDKNEFADIFAINKTLHYYEKMDFGITYDALGCETQRTDARGVAFVTTYDYLGRVIRRKADSETVTYSYGSAGNGQLKLASESYDGWTMSYTYDSLGRVTGETMSNGTITKSRSYTYGPDGMLATRTLPGGKTYSYSYDSYGNLTGVDAASGALRWDLTGYTGKRTTSTTVLGNSSYYTFNKATVLDQYGYLDSLITNKNGSRYQDDDYNFSPLTGNLMSLDANWMDYPHTFQYDSADRLTRVQENNQDIMYMTYSANGNILSKTGIGYYEYSNTTQPHAVTAVDNFENWIEDTIQYVSYNSWGKLESLYSIRDGDVYYYSIEYGPDLQRVRSSLYRNGQPLYSKFYWDDYEEKTVDNTTYLYWYVNGADGLAGIMLGNAQNSSWSCNLAAITDHLGSIMALWDNNDPYYSCSYDAWGNRTIGMESPLGVDRGFCGHEHIDEIGLINMNGRMYDPKLGRFLSPDPYIQAPTDPQNFNRYSYCLNNPLKYTDPDGNLFGETLLTGIIDFFTTAFFKGGLDITSPGAMRDAWRDFDPTASWSKTNKSWKMSVGMYKTDSDKNFWGRAWQLISRFTWEAPQAYLGSTVNQVHNIFGGVKSVDYYGGATVVESYAEEWGAFTLGNYINGERGIKASVDNKLFRHEYGHYLQSMSWGALYIPRFGLPSFWDAMGDKTLDYPVEVDANKRAFKYFSKYIEGFTTYDTENDYWDSKWDFRNAPISSDGSRNNARSGMSSWKEGLLRFKWYDLIANDPFGLINHNIVYQLMKY